MHVHAQAQDEYERRLKEEMDAKLQKEREIEQLVSRVGLAQPAVIQGYWLLLVSAWKGHSFKAPPS